MKQSFKTSKLYYGFPIFILGYQDQNFGHNITTCSSSYSLGDWLVIGVGAEENAADQIKHYQQFTVNIPDKTSCWRWNRLDLLVIGKSWNTWD